MQCQIQHSNEGGHTYTQPRFQPINPCHLGIVAFCQAGIILGKKGCVANISPIESNDFPKLDHYQKNVNDILVNPAIDMRICTYLQPPNTGYFAKMFTTTFLV